ncbi:carbohydrate-binding protein [Hymenobacter jeollabukensis]|uniref:Carbohydrate-binding protein n=1 Tax=Hymenobacter jeollabukensis TaxID=2025313 RepID=A0A5R8WJY2_9BACT|nr:carbohydrate-binding protein [Hymenobacter jeollabukensis]TLM89098.1 carbohydrate-binding protein [Hymenobacter jeollabukensis]
MKRLLLLFALGWLATAAGYAQRISPYIAGQNAWLPKGYGGAVYNGQLDQLWPVVRKSKVQMVRIGGNGVEFNMPTPAEYLALIDSIRGIGAEPMVQVSQGRGKYTAQQAAAVVDYVNRQMGRGVKYWIIGNEPNLAGSHTTVSVAGVEAYIKSWASAMKQVDPGILIVGPETSFYDTSYLNPLIGGANDITGQDANGNYYVDIVTFHSYPFSGTQTRSQVLNAAGTISGNVDRLLTLMSAANALHNRTGAHALQWAVTEFNLDYKNPTDNGVAGLGVHGFLNGQYWAEVFGVGMQKGAVTMMPWSIHEGNGARGEGDLGYLDGSGAGIKPRSAYYHEMLVAENLRGTFLPATDNQAEVSVLGSRHGDTTAVLVLNKSNTTDFDFTVQLSGAAVPGAAPLKINVPAGIGASYSDKIYGQSTLVLLFDGQGQLTRKIVYSLQHAANTLPPTYLRPGQQVTLAAFAADKTFTCVAPEQVTYSASVLGTYSALSWNFGADATPATATGIGPFAVSYATAGPKSVTMTLQNADTTIVVSKPDYVQASACVRTPFAGTAPVVPGVIKAVEFDNGGQNVAYYDSDAANRGAALNPNVPRPTESVDTELGDGGIGNIGYSASGEWLKYTVNVQRTGLYKLTVRVAASAAGGSLRLWADGVDKTGVITVPVTGGFGVYQDLVISNVYLEANPAATLKFDLVTSSFNFSKLSFEEQAPAGIVVNRIYNASSTPDGMSDAVELLVTKDHQDLRGLIVKDFETNLTSDAGGKYQFKDQALWKDVRIGTTIVLRRLAAGITGYAEDLDAADYKLDLLLENGTYLTNLAPGNSFNLTNTDMVLLKTGAAAGTAGAVHAFATGSSNTALFNAVTSPKLVSASITNTGAFQYPLSATQTGADYDGVKAQPSTDANRNWGNGYGAANIAYIQSLRNAAFTPPGIVVNRVYNGSNDGVGTSDAVELLVTQDHYDARNLVVKDFETNNTADNGGKYRLNNVAFWQDLRQGTTIVLRRLSSGIAGYQQDTDASDFTLDMLLENTGYLTNLATGNSFNITQYDMVLLKTGTAAGVSGAIHAFATKGGGSNGVPSALFNSVVAPKLTSPDGTDAGGGTFHYPLNPEQQLTDYAGAKGALSKSTALNWGYGFGAANVAYIQSLRNAALPAPTALTATTSGNRVTLSWTDNATDETGYEVQRSLDGVSYAALTTVGTDASRFVDSCRSYATRYYYRVRTTGQDLASAFAPAASVLTDARPAIVLPALRGECSVTASAPTTADLCGGTVAATTADPTSYAAQGSYGITWSFAFADGSTATATQQVLVQDQTAPTVRTRNLTVQLDANGQASITAADIDNGSADACGLQALALSQTTFDCSHVGPNPVTLTVTDVNGNVATADAVVLVEDHVAPTVATRNISVTLAGGAASITAADVDNGSADACGIQALALNRSRFDCSNLGPNVVTLTVTDRHGNAASAPATVTVIGAVPAPAIALSRTDNTFTGLPANTLALGYGAQRLTLAATNGTSAAGATSYAWTPAAGLSSVTAASPIFTPTTAGSYTFTVTATNEFGCVGTASVTIDVIDARCGNRNDKVLVCHHGNLLCISANAVATHLAQHGDQLGGCATAARGTTGSQPAVVAAVAAAVGSEFEAFPNPFAGLTTLRFRPVASGAAQLHIYNALGQLVTTLYDAPAEAGRAYEVTLDGGPLRAGVYTCRLLSGGQVETRRVVLVK